MILAEVRSDLEAIGVVNRLGFGRPANLGWSIIRSGIGVAAPIEFPENDLRSTQVEPVRLTNRRTTRGTKNWHGS